MVVRTPSSLTDPKTGDLSKSKVRLLRERSKLPMLSPSATLTSEVDLEAEVAQCSQQRARLKKTIKGELPAIQTQPKHKSTLNITANFKSSFRETLPQFARELSNMSNQTHKFIRETQGEPSANDLYLDLWRKRTDLKKLNSRTSSVYVTPSPSMSRIILSEVNSPTVHPKVKTNPSSPVQVRKFTFTKVTKEAKPMLDYISRMQHLID